MPTTVVNSDTSDGSVLSYTFSGNYEQAREGTDSLTTNVSLLVGQSEDAGNTYFDCYESFLNFDLLGAGIPSGATVSSAALELYCVSNDSVADFNVEARSHNWGSTLTTADFVAGSALGGNTLLCSASTSGMSASSYATITESGTALKDAVSAALVGDGVVRIVVDSADQQTDTPPSNPLMSMTFRSSQSAAGNRPKLTVTYTVPATDTYVAPTTPHPPHLRAKTEVVIF